MRLQRRATPAECGAFRSNNRAQLRRALSATADAPRGAPKDKSGEVMAVVAFDDDVVRRRADSRAFFYFVPRDRIVVACPLLYGASVSGAVRDGHGLACVMIA
ncbi:hypothetical protein HPB50_004193 [Hyalomma asiaticum]|uniref:Uncharacterized protein n=1 Tax=Hyalomma asiaticum TaxID=266040 RepID=A0ACB7SUU1_HYAAI|nr:hypothetical protein HPB50_004193 [Hyalomma asiaticum]